MEPFSQKFEVLTQAVDVINPNMARKWTQTCIPCTNGDRKMKVKSKNNFVVWYSLMELFFQNLEILVPCCDAIVSKLGQKDSNSYITLWFGSKKNLWQNFWILKHRSSLWRHYSKTGTIRAELTSKMRFSTSRNCRRFWSLIQLATLQKSYFHGYLFLQNTISDSL